MRDFLFFSAVIAVVFVIGCAPLMGWDYWRCGVLSEQTGRATDYILFDGCYIEYAGHYIPRERFIGAQVVGE